MKKFWSIIHNTVISRPQILPIVRSTSFPRRSPYNILTMATPCSSTTNFVKEFDDQSDRKEVESVEKGEESQEKGEESQDIVESEREVGGAIGSSGFTSELFKIEIKNVPPYAGFKQVRKRLNSLKLHPIKVKLIPTERGCCFVTFKNEEEREFALSVINGHVWKTRTLKAQYSKPNIDPLLKKRKASEAVSSKEDEQKVKRPCITPDLTQEEINERLLDAVTPLWKVPYEEQLVTKFTEMKSCLKETADFVKKIKPGKWFYDQVKENEGMLCPLLPILPSPVQVGYRNKCEFSAGYNHINEPVIGFRLGSYEERITAIAPPTPCINVPEPSKKFTEVLLNYIQKSDYKPVDVKTWNGHWDKLIVKSFTSGESMCIIVFHRQTLTEDDLSKEKAKVIEFFKEGEGSQYCPTSLYWLTIDSEKGVTKKFIYEHLLGEKYIHENILGLKFRVSPEAFFQINTPATEVLYSTIADYCTASDTTTKPSTVFDVCCGTGTIGITLAKRLPSCQFYGVELSEQAIEDAKYNAQMNGVANIDFISGRAEDVLPSLMLEMSEKGVVKVGGAIAIVDPPRAGLHQRVIQAIRRTKSIHKLIYISCDPDRIKTNISDLCRDHSNRIKGAPFRPVSAVPVDLFPHTNHCELILTFERLHQTELAPHQ